MAKYTGKWTRDSLLALLDRDDLIGWTAVERSLVALHERQTIAEQNTEQTLEHNGVGFQSCHASTGSWLVKTVIAEAKAKGYGEGRRLRGKAFVKAHKIVRKYAGTQLLEIARAKEAASQPKQTDLSL